jgi:outer membrane receptor protein involved in Fe transport
VLPAATVTYRFIDDFQLRSGYSRTLNRPDLRELSSSQYDDIEANAVLRGSAALQRASIDSFDMRLEWYLTNDEVLSVGGFYKHFDKPIELTVQPGAEIIYTFQNADSARTFGLELDARKRLTFLGSAFEPLYLAANFAWIDSEVGITLESGRRYERPLQSQSPWVVNAQLGWDDAGDDGTGTAFALLYNVSGRRIRAVSNPNLNIPEQYEEPFHRLDFVLSQTLPRGFKLGVRAQNLLNAEQTWKQGDIVVRRFRRGVDLAASVAYSY